METRITQEALRRHVLRVLRCWRERFMFSDDYLNGLQVWVMCMRTGCVASMACRCKCGVDKLGGLNNLCLCGCGTGLHCFLRVEHAHACSRSPAFCRG